LSQIEVEFEFYLWPLGIYGSDRNRGTEGWGNFYPGTCLMWLTKTLGKTSVRMVGRWD